MLREGADRRSLWLTDQTVYRGGKVRIHRDKPKREPLMQSRCPLFPRRGRAERPLSNENFLWALSLIEQDAITNPHCSRRSDHGVHAGARELAEVADLYSIVADQCPKNIRILG